MTLHLALGLGAGLTSGLLYCSVLTGSPLAMVLFYLAPLPVMLIGLGWGRINAVAGAVAGALAVAFFLRADAGLYYALTCAAPAVWLSHLAMLSRPGGGDGKVEWYPPGRILGHATILSCVLAAGAMVAFGPDAESYRDNVRAVVEALMEAGPGFGGELVGAENVEEFSDRVASLLLPATVTVWLVTMLANLWVAGRVLHASGRLGRPWPRFIAVELPRFCAAIFAACAAALLIPGSIGIVGAAAASGWVIAYMLVGLAVLHAATLGMSARGLLLAVLYFTLLVFMFAGLVVALIGLAEPFLRIRERALAQRPPPDPD